MDKAIDFLYTWPMRCQIATRWVEINTDIGPVKREKCYGHCSTREPYPEVRAMDSDTEGKGSADIAAHDVMKTPNQFVLVLCETRA